ncbi:MAG: hypothetical protein KDI88_03380 [Gammaproteobacteria bacterium]|nr:hypothetical protein [Gammaproteobacteria bacterium]
MQELIAAVQHNCDIADARHGGDFGMCTYLLKMRERYRWEQGLPLGATLDRDAVGDWLTAREQRLEALVDDPFVELPCNGRRIDPFDAETVNATIGPLGLVYSAGLVQGARENFFIGELEQETRSHNGFGLRVSGRELARCLNAPPAMTRGTTIFLRRESLRRYLWERYESWLWNRPQNAMARAIACYPFATELDAALDAMTAAEMAVIEAHERGEYEAGLDLGEAWDDMLIDLAMTPAELMARAVRDHLADCTYTLPMLLKPGREASLHLFVANLGAMRKQLFPALQAAYADWLDGAGAPAFDRLVEKGRCHWRDLAHVMLVLHRRHGDAASGPIAAAVGEACL